MLILQETKLVTDKSIILLEKVGIKSVGLFTPDLTGREVLRALILAVRGNKNITIKENHFAVDLITSDKFDPNFESNSCTVLRLR